MLRFAVILFLASAALAYPYGRATGGVVHDTAGYRVYCPSVSQRQGTTGLFFHADWLGSTRYLTDSSGNNAPSAYRFDAYGGTTASAGPDSTSFKWVGAAGYQSDGPAGLVLLGQRYYDPQVGRFLSPDPIGLAGGFNEHGCCARDPVNAGNDFGAGRYGWGTFNLGMAGLGALGEVGAIGGSLSGTTDDLVTSGSYLGGTGRPATKPPVRDIATDKDFTGRWSGSNRSCSGCGNASSPTVSWTPCRGSR